jgi:probable F420-dependent oxidoreductase
MHFGAICGNGHFSIQPAPLGRALEERSFESVWFPEHTHIPAARTSPYPFGGELPEIYWNMQDPFLSALAAAAATERLKVGTGICLVVEHDLIYLAKQVATLDRLSGGRFLFGIGGGWNAEEMENHGTPFARRWKVLRERIEAMKAIWTQKEASYAGEFVHFDAIWAEPKPLTHPHPPILLGGLGPKGLQRVVDYCDGWIVLDVDGGRSVAAGIEALTKRAEAAGRDPASIEKTVMLPARPDAARFARYRELGMDRTVVFLPDYGEDKALRRIDQIAELMPDFR